MATIRKNIYLHDDLPEERRCVEFLGKIGRRQGQFIAVLTEFFLSTCGISDPSSLPPKVAAMYAANAKEILQQAASNKDSKRAVGTLQTVNPETEAAKNPTPPPPLRQREHPFLPEAEKLQNPPEKDSLMAGGAGDSIDGLDPSILDDLKLFM